MLLNRLKLKEHGGESLFRGTYQVIDNPQEKSPLLQVK